MMKAYFGQDNHFFRHLFKNLIALINERLMHSNQTKNLRVSNKIYLSYNLILSTF